MWWGYCSRAAFSGISCGAFVFWRGLELAAELSTFGARMSVESRRKKTKKALYIIYFTRNPSPTRSQSPVNISILAHTHPMLRVVSEKLLPAEALTTRWAGYYLEGK